jgi:hypothetical protein
MTLLKTNCLLFLKQPAWLWFEKYNKSALVKTDEYFIESE